MLEAKITLDCTSRFESAIYRLAEALAPSLNGTPEVEPVTPDNVAPISAPMQEAANHTAMSAATAPMPATAGTEPTSAVAASAAVPVSAAPAYTLEQVSNAGAELIASNPEKATALRGLLAQFGAPCVNMLKQEQLGAFATALRGLGANI